MNIWTAASRGLVVSVASLVLAAVRAFGRPAVSAAVQGPGVCEGRLFSVCVRLQSATEGIKWLRRTERLFDVKQSRSSSRERDASPRLSAKTSVICSSGEKSIPASLPHAYTNTHDAQIYTNIQRDLRQNDKKLRIFLQKAWCTNKYKYTAGSATNWQEIKKYIFCRKHDAQIYTNIEQDLRKTDKKLGKFTLQNFSLLLLLLFFIFFYHK